jgi:sulfite reductase beta subunit-like hemoprotein
MKYTVRTSPGLAIHAESAQIDDMGLDNFKAEVEKRLGYELEPARPYEFTHNTDSFGWEQGDDGNWHFAAFIEVRRGTSLA